MRKFNRSSIVVVSAVFLMFSVFSITTFAAGPATVNLGSAGDFVVLAKSGISTTGTTLITGDIGVSPINAVAITGFGLTMDTSSTFSTSALVNGKVYAADYTAPTPTKMTTAISDMETAYTDAAGRTSPIETGLGAGDIGGMTLAPGLYKWGTNVIIPTDVTLSGGANDVWIFQIAQNLTISSDIEVVLSGGAQASNIFWQVAGQTTLGTNSVFNGNILDQTAIVLNTGATLNGRALAQTAVTLDADIVSLPVVSVTTPVNGSCSTTHYSCNTGTSVSNVDGSTTWTWSCTGLNSGTTASCSETKPVTTTPVNGSCSTTHYSCNTGTSASNVDGSTTWTWSCTGLDGGTTASCSETKPVTTTPVNGSCSTTHYSCNTGTSVSNVDGSITWTWSCTGLNSGTTASCSETKPVTTTPTPINGSCSTTHYNCNIGASVGNLNGSTAWTWSCTGLYGGTITSCLEIKPVTPTSVIYTSTTPGLPNTGIGPNEKSITPWSIVIPAGILTILALVFFARKKQSSLIFEKKK